MTITLLLEIFKRQRISDLALRVFIVGLLLALGTGMAWAWTVLTTLSHVRILDRLISIGVMALVGWVGFMMIAPLIIGQKNARRAAHGSAAVIAKASVWLAKVAAMTLLNTSILLIRIGFAAFRKEDAAGQIVDAGTHYIERQADLILKPMK